ncbi:MAG: hypothetical protein IIW27_00005, partial [Clostridia bacterium]|nr:hypothetical protein [Clostridia bacterium]
MRHFFRTLAFGRTIIIPRLENLVNLTPIPYQKIICFDLLSAEKPLPLAAVENSPFRLPPPCARFVLSKPQRGCHTKMRRTAAVSLPLAAVENSPFRLPPIYPLPLAEAKIYFTAGKIRLLNFATFYIITPSSKNEAIMRADLHMHSYYSDGAHSP